MTLSQIKIKFSAAAIGLAGLVGVAFSLIVFAVVYHANRQEARDEFLADAEERYAVIKREIGSQLLMVEAIQAFFEHADVVIRPEFRDFTRPLLSRHTGIRALEWAPLVPAADRGAYEQTARREGSPGYRITERGGEGTMLRAGARAEYFPALFVEPIAGNEIMLGYDLGSEAVRRASLERARDTGLITSSSKITLLTDTNGQFGVLIFAPVYRRGPPSDTVESRRKNLKGFALGVLRIKDIVERSLSDLAPSGVDVVLYDQDAPGKEHLLYFHPSRLRADAPSSVDDGEFTAPGRNDPFSFSRSLEVAGRTWLVRCRPMPGYMRGRGKWLPWGILSVGLAFTAFLTNHVRVIVRHAKTLAATNERLQYENDKRSKAEDALEEQKRFAENLIENSAVATFVLDSAHTIVMWNKACEALTGVPAVDMLGTSNQWKPFYDRQRPALADIVLDAAFDKLPGLYQTYETSALAPNALHAEGWYAKLNGKDRYILFDAAPLHDRSGKLIAVVETLQDITERKRVEEFYEENRNILRAITDTAPDAIVLIDDEGKVLYWNPSAASMLGYSGENILGKNITTIIPERYRASHGAAFRKFVETGKGALLGRTYEVFARRKDGTEIPVELSISGVWLKEKWHAAGIIREITERKKLEDQLRQAQKMEAIGQLAGGIAHDFNNILSVIVGYGHLLQVKMREDDPLRVNVEHILAAAGRAAQLTHSLLAFSRKQIINPRPVDLNAVVQRVGTMLMRLIGEDVDLRLSLSKKRLTVLADSSQLEQVLMNFATNARDAMPQGGSFSIATDLVEVDDSFSRAHGYGEPGAYAMISLADTGVGMDETTRKKIFDPFFTTKEPGRGTGLGLSIVYGIIKQHNGYINVYSEPGKGTTFRIYLPVVQEEVETRKDNALPAREIGGSETILLVEDDKALRTLSRTILEEFGYRVIEANDGVDALEKFMLYKDAIHLVILDMIMPRKGGKETYDEITKAWPEVKAIFMSGYTADKVHLDDILARGIELLLKPVSPRTLLKKVREALDKKTEKAV